MFAFSAHVSYGGCSITVLGEYLPLAVGLPPLLGSDDAKIAELQSTL